MEVRVHEMAVATLRMLQYLMVHLPGSFSQLQDIILPEQFWDPHSLAAAEAAHKAEGERLRLDRMEQERYQKEVAERAEAARQALPYRAREEKLSREMTR
jgi:hypothetical protein